MGEKKPSEESHRFVCVDPAGNEVHVIAQRDLFETETGVRFGLWNYRTANDRFVRAGAGIGEYVMMPGNVPLTAVDPEEPTKPCDASTP